MTRKLIWVRWRDSAIASQAYLGKGELPDSITEFETVGFFVAQDRRALTLAIDWQEENKRWRGIIGIPVENIVKKRVLKVDVS